MPARRSTANVSHCCVNWSLGCRSSAASHQEWRGAALWAWTLALICGAVTGGGYAYLLAETLICGAFMSAVGVRASLAFSTATRSMAVAVGVWLVALGVIQRWAGNRG